GQMVQPVRHAELQQNLKITFPQPATLIVHYDIPGDLPEASLSLQLGTNQLEMPLWKDIILNPFTNVPNHSQVVLNNLTPGTYDFYRSRFGGTTNSGYAYLFGDPHKVVQS